MGLRLRRHAPRFRLRPPSVRNRVEEGPVYMPVSRQRRALHKLRRTRLLPEPRTAAIVLTAANGRHVEVRAKHGRRLFATWRATRTQGFARKSTKEYTTRRKHAGKSSEAKGGWETARGNLPAAGWLTPCPGKGMAGVARSHTVGPTDEASVAAAARLSSQKRGGTAAAPFRPSSGRGGAASG